MRRVVAVVGPTAVGKTEVAAAIAKACEGEVISADAYQVYAGMDVGTAKPSVELRDRVRHHLIDITFPGLPMTLAEFLDNANEALEDIWGRHKLPVVAGGSGQYVWALLEGWHVPRVPPDDSLRQELEAFAVARGAAALHGRLAQLDPVGAGRLDAQNVRRVVRALELVIRTGLPLAACQTRAPLDADLLTLGLGCPRGELLRRIDTRVDAMFTGGFIEEVAALRSGGYGQARPVREGIGYKQVSAYLDGDSSLAEAIEATKAATHRLTRNQRAWFKASDPRIEWIEAGERAAMEAVDLVRTWLDQTATV